MRARPFRVGVMAYHDCIGSEVFGFTDLLTMANQVACETGHASAPHFDVSIISPRRRVSVSGGVSVGVAPMADVDLLVVPGFELLPSHDLDERLGRLRREIDAIRERHDLGIPLASICVGAFLLGEAGLLDGRRVTTAWLFAQALAARYPDATVDQRALILHDRGVTSTAAFSATSHLAMDLIRERCGVEVARITARIGLIADGRTSQAPFVDDAILTAPPQRFSDEVKHWLENEMVAPYQLSELASAFHVSTRTMLRRFGAETGESPLTYLQRIRVRRAKALLETTDLRLSEVMSAVGYLDPGTFRRLFTEHTGVSPADYRREFRRPHDRAERWAQPRRGHSRARSPRS
jgi:transcriptional regulator GlxA family with amidase domain